MALLKEIATPEMCAYCFDSLMQYYDPNHIPFKPTFPNDSYPIFVTWHKRKKTGKELRGCIGTFSEKPLVEGLKEYALSSALRDSRFSPIKQSEIPYLSCGVSVLYSFEKQESVWDWDVGIHGIIIDFIDPVKKTKRNATYLPEVMPEQGWTREDALKSLIRKAGWKGVIDRPMIESCQLTRYKSSKNKIDFKKYQQNFAVQKKEETK